MGDALLKRGGGSEVLRVMKHTGDGGPSSNGCKDKNEPRLRAEKTPSLNFPKRRTFEQLHVPCAKATIPRRHEKKVLSLYKHCQMNIIR